MYISMSVLSIDFCWEDRTEQLNQLLFSPAPYSTTDEETGPDCIGLVSNMGQSVKIWESCLLNLIMTKPKST